MTGDKHLFNPEHLCYLCPEDDQPAVAAAHEGHGPGPDGTEARVVQQLAEGTHGEILGVVALKVKRDSVSGVELRAGRREQKEGRREQREEKRDRRGVRRERRERRREQRERGGGSSGDGERKVRLTRVPCLHCTDTCVYNVRVIHVRQ